MKSSLVALFVLIGLGTTGAWGSPLCTNQSATGVGGSTLNYYVLQGATGCSVNGVLFYNFSYSYNLTGSGGGSAVPDSSVKVTVDPTTSKFTFGSTWIATDTQVGTLSITFDVNAPGDEYIKSLTSAFTGNTSGSPAVYVPAATCTGGTCSAPTFFTSTTVNIPKTGGPLVITDTLSLKPNGTGNFVHVSLISDRFGVVVPEPATYGMFGIGLAALAFFRRRK